MNQIEQIVNWQKERLLDKQKFDLQTELTNIVEEIWEMFGHAAARSRAKNDVANLFECAKLYGLEQAEDEELADAFADIIVFSVGALLKLGYCPACVIAQTLQEINSRTGKIENGKWVKDTSKEAKAKWYKADFKGCKR